MIPTGENGIFNVLVYTDAKYEEPSIKKILKIKDEDNDFIDLIRSEIYYAEQRASLEDINFYREEGVFEENTARDYDYAEWQRRRKAEASKGNGRNRSKLRDGRGSDKSDKRLSLKDDNEPPVDRFEGVIPSEDEMDREQIKDLTELLEKALLYRKVNKRGRKTK